MYLFALPFSVLEKRLCASRQRSHVLNLLLIGTVPQHTFLLHLRNCTFESEELPVSSIGVLIIITVCLSCVHRGNASEKLECMWAAYVFWPANASGKWSVSASKRGCGQPFAQDAKHEGWVGSRQRARRTGRSVVFREVAELLGRDGRTEKVLERLDDVLLTGCERPRLRKRVEGVFAGHYVDLNV